LLGFSSGGGFVLRFAASAQQALFDRYILLSPYLRYDAPTAKPNNENWVSVGIPRTVALILLNGLGIKAWNHLEVTRFALDDYAKTILTPTYSHALAINFAPHANYVEDIQHAKGNIQIIAGANDELFDATRFSEVFEKAGKKVKVTILPGTDHMGLILQKAAVQAIAELSKL
jgi:alpha-beta hydrolase superfamily lysophospholipase